MSLTNQELSDADRGVMDLIRHEGALSVNGLCELMGVTATAVRQRLSRLAAGELIERFQEKKDRGRPVHLYRLTKLGLQAIGDNFADLAEALWEEVVQISDPKIRQAVINGVLRRLIDKYKSEVSGETVTERLQSIASLFRKRKIPFVVRSDGKISHLQIVGCPYPGLDEHGSEICQLEQQLVTALLDSPVALNHCSCDSTGGQCCMFSAERQLQLNQPVSQQLPSADAKFETPLSQSKD